MIFDVCSSPLAISEYLVGETNRPTNGDRVEKVAISACSTGAGAGCSAMISEGASPVSGGLIG